MVKTKIHLIILLIIIIVCNIFNYSFAFPFNNVNKTHLNEIVAFSDAGGTGKYFDIAINDRTYRFKEVLLNDRAYEDNDAQYLILEIDSDFIDVGIISSGYYTAVVFNKRLNISESERISIQGEAAHGIASLGGTQAIIDEAERLSIESIKSKTFNDINNYSKVYGNSGKEFYKESPYIMYNKLSDGTFYRVSFEEILIEFAKKTYAENNEPVYEYDNYSYSIDDNGIVMIAQDKYVVMRK